MDALRIEKAIVGGCDWGARTANIIAALWPERCKAMVSVSGYLIGSREANKMPLPPKAELEWWYQFYFATERGRAGYEKYRRDFARLIWQLASPKWNFDDATFDRSAAAFDNPDHVAIVIHNYRWRLGLADGEPQVRRAGEAARRRPGHHRARPSRSKATPTARRTRTQRLRQEVLGQVRAPDHHRRHRPQPAAGSAAGLRRSRDRGRRLLTRPAGLARAAVAVRFLFASLGTSMVFIGGLAGTRLAGDGQAALGVGAHLVERRLVRALDLLAEGAGLGAGVDLGRARRDRAVGGGAHLVERGLADARDGVGIARGSGRSVPGPMSSSEGFFARVPGTAVVCA